MKKEIHPALIVAILVILVGGVIAVFMMTTNQGTEKVNVETLDPKSLADPDPRSDPSMRARPEGE
jgi:flagellar basal body-associated protein FliL